MAARFLGFCLVVSAAFAAPVAAMCVGDCSADGAVTVDEVVTGVSIGLGGVALTQCAAMDGGADGDVTVDEIITAVNNALNGCSITPAPTPTATSTVPTATPGERPTSPPGCPGGYVRATFSEASGTNAYTDLDGSDDLFKVEATLVTVPPGVVSFGGGGVTCPTSLEAPIQTVRVTIGGNVDIAVGQTFQLTNKLNFTDTTKPTSAFVDYIEIIATNPFGTRGWRADSGTFRIDSIVGDMAHASVDAHMVPEPSFSAQTPATGTFRMQVSITIDMIGRA